MYIFKWGNTSMTNFTNEITFTSSLGSNRCRRRDRGLVMQVCERDPSLIVDVVHHTSQEERGRDDHHTLPDSDSPDWCVCGRRHEMPSEEEGECCRHLFTSGIFFQIIMSVKKYD